MNTEVTKIDLKEKKVWMGDYMLVYDTLVSTLPIPVFNKLTGTNTPFKTLDIRAVDITVDKPIGSFIADFTYVSDPNYNFHRITKSCDGKTLSFEILEGLEEYFDDHLQFIEKQVGFGGDNIEAVTEKHFKFPITDETPTADNAIFIGRFATGNYNTKVEDTIDEIKRIKATV